MWRFGSGAEGRGEHVRRGGKGRGEHVRGGGRGRGLCGVSGLAVAVLILAFSAAGCGKKGGGALVLAATRDLEGFGVLKAWVEEFERGSPYEVELVTAVDRELLEMAKHGDCDVLLAHVSEETQSLENYGYVEGRREVMRDDYLLVGPAEDPAQAAGATSFPEAFTRVAKARRPFIMRTDGSGVSLQAYSLWEAAGVEDFQDWMEREEGDMRDALRRASREGAYAFCDRSTYESIRGELMLEVIYDGGGQVVNSYYVMAVSALPYPDTNVAGAREFTEYLLSERARKHLALGCWVAPPEEQ